MSCSKGSLLLKGLLLVRAYQVALVAEYRRPSVVLDYCLPARKLLDYRQRPFDRAAAEVSATGLLVAACPG